MDVDDLAARRASLALLADRGEVDTLVATARHDPSDDVRAAAFTLVARLASQGAIPAAVVVEAYVDAPPPIRCAILDGVAAGAAPPLCALVLDALDRGASDEQRAASDAALRTGDPEARGRALRWQAKHVPSRPVDRYGDLDRAPPGHLATWILDGRAAGFVERLVAQLAAMDTAPPELAPILRRLRWRASWRLCVNAVGLSSTDERPPGRHWAATHHYTQLLFQIRRVLSRP